VSYCSTVQIQINLDGFLKESLVMNSENTAAIPTKEELIALLKSGKIEEFNRVRLAREIDLAGASLRGANLAWANLAWADLAGANLAWANLAWANLTGVDLHEADLYDANLRRANLTRANLSEADLREANFWGVKGLSKKQSRLIMEELQKSWE
jgi:uncharacterized protein YjbI with pentapeptide repeats